MIFAYIYIQNLYIPKNFFVNNNPETYSFTGFVREKSSTRVELFFSKINGTKINCKLIIYFENPKIDSEFQSLKSFEYFHVSQINLNQIKIYKNGDIAVRLKEKLNSFSHKYNLLAEINFQIHNKINQVSDNWFDKQSSLVKAIVFGLKDDLNKEDKDLYKNLGISHVLVASGANIALITAIIDKFFNFFGKNFLNILIKFLIITIYLSLVGIEGSITRAYFFFIVNLLTLFIDREINYFQKIFIALIFMIFTFPELIFSISLHLSIVATLGIELSSNISKFYKIKNNFVSNFIQNITIIILISILTSFYFSNINLTAIISNLILLQLFEIIVKYGFAVISFGLLASIFALDKLLNFLAFPLQLLLNIISLVSLKINSTLGKSLNFNYKVSMKILLFSYLICIVLWIVLLYKHRNNIMIKAI